MNTPAMALSVLEVFMLTSITQLSMVVYSRILPENPFIEFLFFSIPQYLVFRYLRYAYITYIALFIVLLVFPKKHQNAYAKHTCPIDRLRMLIISLVSLAIFSADFKFYDSSKEKHGIRPSFDGYWSWVLCLQRRAGVL